MSPTAYQPWVKPTAVPDEAETERRQRCLWCQSTRPDLPVYSACVGRLGICLECARKAVAALEEHQAMNGGRDTW